MNKLEKLKELVAENLGCDVEVLKDETNLMDDLQADSLDMVELSMAVEEEFGVNFSDEELQSIKTFGDMKKLLENA